MLSTWVGVQSTVRGGAMRSRRLKISSFDSSSSGDEVDSEVGGADGVFDGGGEADGTGGAGGEFGVSVLRAAQLFGHDIFKHDVEAGDRTTQSEGASCGAGSDDGDVHVYLAERAVTTDS